jgi:group II intron reverse transcriptase/maturase
MSEGKIDQIIELMRHERYRFAPARRVYIPKKNGKLRPLGLPSWSDKLVGEVVRLLLEAYYEPGFSDRSHGFRKRRGCHTALRDIQKTWTGTVWFIEGDISDCFGSLDHQILPKILSEKIHDQRFLRMIAHMLKAGYLEDWDYHDTLSGCPQGGPVSPILSNIYLDKLDKFVERELIPQYTQGTRRRDNPEYHRTAAQLADARRRGDRAAARDLARQLRSLPSKDPADPGYRRLRYIRYADDHILGFTGPKAEAEDIKARLAAFLRETLGLELNQDKTLITHARTQRRGSSATTSPSGTATRNSPEAAARPTGRSRCGSRRTWSRPSAPATGSTANRGTGPGSRTWTATTSSGSTEPDIAAS